MKLPNQISLSVLRCGVALCLAAIATPVCAQTPPPRPLIELKTCDRALQVFEDGTLVETRDGEQSRRRLSGSRMRRLRQTIARAPCRMQFESEVPPQMGSRRGEPVVNPDLFAGDCHVPVIISGTIPEALQAVEVNRRYGGYAGGSIVYLLCEEPTEAQKEWLRRNSHEYIKPKWRRFLLDVTGIVGGQNILEGCKCRRSFSIR